MDIMTHHSVDDMQ